jgi:hypothetical protein
MKWLRTLRADSDAARRRELRTVDRWIRDVERELEDLRERRDRLVAR